MHILQPENFGAANNGGYIVGVKKIFQNKAKMLCAQRRSFFKKHLAALC
jgi:hypothetical protein